jgi:hypothetical protein
MEWVLCQRLRGRFLARCVSARMLIMQVNVFQQHVLVT